MFFHLDSGRTRLGQCWEMQATTCNGVAFFGFVPEALRSFMVRRASGATARQHCHREPAFFSSASTPVTLFVLLALSGRLVVGCLLCFGFLFVCIQKVETFVPRNALGQKCVAQFHLPYSLYTSTQRHIIHFAPAIKRLTVEPWASSHLLLVIVARPQRRWRIVLAFRSESQIHLAQYFPFSVADSTSLHERRQRIRAYVVCVLLFVAEINAHP